MQHAPWTFLNGVDLITSTVRCRNVVIDVKVEHKKLRFFGAVPAADGAHQSTVAAANAPHDAATAAALQRNQVPQKFARP